MRAARSLPLLLALMAACSLNFDVELIDQKTALENQILTQMRQVREDLVLLSEVRAARERDRAGPTRWDTYMALQNQIYNQDDLDRFKALGYVGETALGGVAVPPGAATPDGEEQQARVRRIVAEENRDRLQIMRYLLAQNQKLAEGDLANIQRVMGDFNRDKATAGHWVQTPAGEWTRKP